MAGGRPPTPTNVLKINGGLRKGRHDDRDREPQPAGDAIQFVELEGEALRAWEFLAPRLIAMGLATEVDSLEVCAMCEWWGEYRKYKTLEDANDYRRLNMAVTAYKQFRVLAAKFGLTAADRVGLEGNMPTNKDEVMRLIKVV